MKYVKSGLVCNEKMKQELEQIEKRYQDDKQRLYDFHDELVEILEFPPSMPDYSGGNVLLRF